MVCKRGLRFLLVAGLFMGCIVRSQGLVTQIVYVKDLQQNPILTASFNLQGSFLDARSNSEGMYRLLLPSNGNYTLEISAAYYETIPLNVIISEASNSPLYVELSPSSFRENTLLEDGTDALTLSESDLEGLGGDAAAPYLLQATRDIFLGSAAFDFGQAFFKIKSLDAKYGAVFVNGIQMNKWYNGRPQWSDWGGLNTLTRQQTYSHGLSSVSNDFGGLLGSTHLSIQPSSMRPGWHFSSSLSNRSYALREMVTYVSPLKNGISMAVGGSFRGAKRGYQQGTPYKAFSGLASIEYAPNEQHRFNSTLIYTFNKRGRSAALTQEVATLHGSDYNPYWGHDKGVLRNSRNKTLLTKTLLFNYDLRLERFRLNLALGHIAGKDIRSRLSYFNAPNPDPTYYKKLPSYYLNSPIGANYYAAITAKEALRRNPQIQWEKLYEANTNLLGQDRVAYLESEDVLIQNQFTGVMRLFWELNDFQELDLGVEWRLNPIAQYAQIKDLLGGKRHLDIDPFSQTLNDVGGAKYKNEGDIFGYHYLLRMQGKRAYIQWRGNFRHWDAFASLSAQQRSGYRLGKMQNERYLDSSLGKDAVLRFNTIKAKIGASYKFNGRHQLQMTLLQGREPIEGSKWYINPRDRPLISPDIKAEHLFWTEVNYHLRLPKILGRFNLFYGRFKDQNSLRYFFTETALGADFVQEWVSGQNTKHIGFEFGFQHQISAAVQINFSGALGKYTITNNPNVKLFFDPGLESLQPNNLEGVQDFGAARVKGASLPLGPARAFSLGISYRDPSYWWFSVSLNSLGLSYVGPSYLRSTAAFLLPDQLSGEPLSPTTNLLTPTQRSLPSFHLMNLVAGKSWLVEGKYTSLFLSVNNLLNQQYLSGGYEQSRKASIESFTEDQRSGQPSFDTKFWHGSGRTFFLNLNISLPPKGHKK